MKYSILMPYYNRLPQFENTVRSLQHQYPDREWEIILVEDGKNGDGVLLPPDVAGQQLKMDGPCSNPAAMYNAAAKRAQYDQLVLTSPECFHHTDVLGAFDKEPDAYRIAACMAVRTLDRHGAYTPRKWFQHSQHRNRRLHFCAAIPKAAYFDIGGFDEAYADGYCFDDDDFIAKVDASDLKVVLLDEALVLHQVHAKRRPRNYMVLWNRNRAIYESKWGAYKA